MAALDFPTSPTLNDIYSANGKTFQWNGVSWVNITSQLLTYPGANVDFQDNVLIAPILKDYGLWHNALGTLTSNATINITSGNYVSATVGAILTFTFSNPTPTSNACGFILELTNGGSAAVTWPAAVKWPSATAPTLTTSGVDVLTFITDDGGTTWRGVVSMQDSS